jgi:uncharacterized protein (TIGR02147 family)
MTKVYHHQMRCVNFNVLNIALKLYNLGKIGSARKMMENSIFHFDSYRQFMFSRLSAEGKRGQLSKAAASLGCQASFLSRVINEELHLTPDHSYKLARFWSLAGDEMTYFLKLVEWERAGDPEFQSFLKKQLQDLKKKNLDVGTRTQRKDKTFEGLSTKYFSSWIHGAIHFLTCVPEYQTVASLSKRLALPDKLVKEVLADLQQMSFIEKKGERWIYQSGEFHLDRTSPLVVLHHQNWRQRAVIDAQAFDPQSFHYTTILTLSKKDIAKIHAMIADTVAEIQRIAGPSHPEDEVILTCDFFRA